MSVPKSMKDKYEQIASLITDFCREHLSDDHRALCLKLLEKLCQKRPSPLLKDRVNTWAAGIVYAIAANNFIFDRSQPIHMTAEELSSPFGLARSTAANKAAEIARMCGVRQFEPEWMLPELAASSPMVWFLEVNGFLMDMRTAPVELQIEAYERGFIPYVPALRQAEKEHEASAADLQTEPAPEKKTEGPEPAEPAPDEPEDFSDIYRAFGAE